MVSGRLKCSLRCEGSTSSIKLICISWSSTCKLLRSLKEKRLLSFHIQILGQNYHDFTTQYLSMQIYFKSLRHVSIQKVFQRIIEWPSRMNISCIFRPHSKWLGNNYEDQFFFSTTCSFKTCRFNDSLFLNTVSITSFWLSL